MTACSLTGRRLRAAAAGAFALLPMVAAGQQGGAAAAHLEVQVTDAATTRPTAVRVRLLDATGAAAPLPEQAVPLMYGEDDRAEGYGYQPDSSFYVGGRFAQSLPPGRYSLAISKGHEYLAQRHDLDLVGGDTLHLDLAMERWVDMPAAGWYSVDDHIHLRRSPRENPIILTWLAAEDIHVGALLQMGDINATYFAQYAWGEEGVYQIEDRFLASGQEDPRTHEIGHTISLGADEFVRSTRQYYYYDRTFDRIRELGGVTGYAHQGVQFHGYRGLTLDVLGEKVDFMEVLQFCNDIGPLETAHYYHFLDLGFRLTATAGSDFPWCGRANGPQIGNARFYSYMEGELTFEKWLESIRSGHTFVSSGPMLEFTVAGRIPGETVEVSRGDRVRVRATARGHPQQVPLRVMEIVVHGEVVARATAEDGGEQGSATLAIDFEQPVEHGFWIAARASAGGDQFAHTTPVYVMVDSSFHNPRTILARLDASEGFLREIEAEVAEASHDRQQHAWRFACPESEPGCLGEGLRERIADTRETIVRLRERHGGSR